MNNPYHFCKYLGCNLIGSKEDCEHCKVEDTQKPLTRESIKIGIHVIDSHGNKGIVKTADDIHNIFVEYYNGGSGLYCIDPDCLHLNNHEIFDPLFHLSEEK